MIATGNHLRFRIRCALQHAPTITRPYRYPERDVEGAVPYKGAVEMVRYHRRGDSRIARGRLIRNQGMIATGNHLRFRIRCALQHSPTIKLDL